MSERPFDQDGFQNEKHHNFFPTERNKMYSTKCVSTELMRRPSNIITHFAKKRDFEGACVPPPCADGYRQLGNVYAEAAGAYAGNFGGQVVFNVVRVCERQPRV